MPGVGTAGDSAAEQGDTAGNSDTAVGGIPKAARALRAVSGCVASRPFRWGFLAVAVAFAGYAVVAQWSQVSRSIDRIGPSMVVLALGSVLLGLLAMMLGWRVLLSGLGSRLPVPAAARVLFLGQLGKYLPGSVWSVLTQMELAKRYQVPRHRSASAAVLSMLVVLLAGLLTALVLLPFTGASSYLWAFAVMPVLLATLHPRVLNQLINRLLRLVRQPPLEHPLSARTIALALGWTFVGWLFNGVQLWFLMIHLGAPLGTGLLLAIGGYAFACSVGFIVVFLPVGAGLRDVLLVTMLGPVLGLGGATAVALMSRVLTTAGDLLTAAASGAWRRNVRPGAMASADATGMN
ncbi:MAG: flippase-like domain-containing protein [Actinobacteria bacterium]|nr:flippase-like domain-containing protein [Actinomycetota bacterium]